MPENEERLGREGVADLAQSEFNCVTLVIGFNSSEGSTVAYFVTASSDTEEEAILDALEDRHDLQRDTALVVVPSSTDSLVFGCVETGVEETRGELPRISVELA